MSDKSLIEEWVHKLDQRLEAKSAEQYRQFPRSALIWLLASIVLVYLPLQLATPLWLMVVAVSVVSWRWMMHLGRWPLPSTSAKVFVVVAGIAAVVASAAGRFNLESATTFMMVAALLKTLEIKSQRDGYIVIFISFFLLAVAFLFDQGLLTTLYALITVVVLIAALVGMHQSNEQIQLQKSLRLSAAIVAISVPMMLIMFFLFPRLEPLWNLNLQSGQARTGLSDRISVGDIAQLSQSDELVFRARFEGERPSKDRWYWRGITLENYVQGEWTRSRLHDNPRWYPKTWQPPEGQAGVYFYNIIQEPNPKNKWLYGLRGVAALENGIGMTSDDRIENIEKLYQRKSYRVASWPDVSIQETGLWSALEYENLLLPQGENPRAFQWAHKLKQEIPDKAQRVQYLLDYFRQQDFYYTLQPPKMPDNEIDQFLFDHKRGFCAHYASAFVYMMRAMDIPARMVAGYQGGELNEETGVITVRQYDAHGWAEVWLEGQGWVSYDPTAQVAPERILNGLQQAIEEEGTFLQGTVLSLHAFKGWPLLDELRRNLDELNYQWHQMVLGYNKNSQSGLMKELFGTDSYKKMLYWLAAGFTGLFFLLAAIIFYQRPLKATTPLEKALQSFSLKLTPLGLGRQPEQGLRDYAAQLKQEFPQEALTIGRIFSALEAHYYRPQAERDEKQLIRQLKTLSSRLIEQSPTSKNNHRPPH